ncbi:hypothetical protein [Tsukamurella strandjordii]|uniref:Transcriptional regulator, AbiEi antitoxin, Type IV TA system n=1 Tax=Tsukamurella strandjordii TaxID=147577 RepID=A0AA90SNA4_9ACTN|nr:hypothetical protein [Tsukamurella strandjordii]MDP0400043.1 hypothetical protein [Tsukamurella strandjordii]
MPDDAVPGYRHRRELLAVGMRDSEIRAAVHRRELTRVWAGAYHRGDALAPWREFAVTVRAAADRTSRRLVLSHAAAAALHGMQILNNDWRTVDFTGTGSRGGSVRGNRRVHLRRLDAHDVCEIDGYAVTTLARTALDLALAGTFEQAVCALDAALRAGASMGELEAAADRLGRRRGTATLRAALPEATALAESVGESLSRALMLRWPEIPRPTLQFELFGPAGNLVARTDFLWSHLVVGEFDGRVKLSTSEADHQLTRDNLLVENGLSPHHWRWLECREPDRLRNRLHAALGPRGLLLSRRLPAPVSTSRS